MASPPYMTVWVADWTADTQHLSCEQDGAYWRLIRALWRAHGVLPNDERKLAHIVGLSVKKWRAISDDVMEFFEVDEASVQHEKLTITLLSVAQKSEERATAGAKGGRAKALKRLKPVLANATGLPPVLPQQTASISDVRVNIAAAATGEGLGDWPSKDARELSAILVAEAHTVKLDPSRQPGLVTSAGRIAAWQRQGFSWADAVVPTVVALAQRAGRPLTSWSYFDSAIAERHALNTRPIPEAEIDHDQQPARRGVSQADHHAARRRGALAFLDEQGDDQGPDHQG